MKWLSFLICLLTLNAAHAAPGGDVIGNGGDGVVIEGQLYLLDLVEFGNFKLPYFDPNSRAESSDLAVLKSISHLPVDHSLLARKIGEIRALSPLLADSLLQAIRMYTWRLVSYELVDVGDENTVVNLPRTQIAIRSRKAIMIFENELLRLNDANRVALILHEMIYAMITPVKTRAASRLEYQQSSVAREINSYLFTESLRSEGHAGLRKLFSIGSSDRTYLPLYDDSIGIPLTSQSLVTDEFDSTLIGYEYIRAAVRGVVEPNADYRISMFAQNKSVPETSFQEACLLRRESAPSVLRIDFDKAIQYIRLKFAEIPTPDGRQTYLSRELGTTLGWSFKPFANIQKPAYVVDNERPGFVYEPKCVKFIRETLPKLK